MSGGWIETPAPDGVRAILKRGEFVIRVGSIPLSAEALNRLVPPPNLEDES